MAIRWVATDHEESVDPMDNKSGFTDDEQKVHDSLVQCIYYYNQLTPQHPSEMPDFINAVHTIQRLLGQRVLRRTYPQGYPTYKQEEI